MKSGIHPTYYEDAIVICACGNKWTSGSTKREIHADVCSNCHPFYTGEQRIVDTAGQVERFMKRQAAKDQFAAQPAEVKVAKKEKRARRRGDMRSGMRGQAAAAVAEEAVSAKEPTAPVSESTLAAAARTAETTAAEAAIVSEPADAPAALPLARERRPRPPRKPRPAQPDQPAAEADQAS